MFKILLTLTFLLLSNLTLLFSSDEIALKSGWNLVGASEEIDINQTFNNENISTVWRWTGSKWEIYSPDTSLSNLIKNYGINTLQKTNTFEGFWVSAKNDLNIQLTTSQSSFSLTSSSFENSGYIPLKFTCDGDDVSPELKWSNPPAGTKSFVLLTDDPDAPGGTWVHWVVYKIPVSVTSFEENVNISSIGAVNGKNSFSSDNLKYRGPCPPDDGKIHHYHFKIFAVDIDTDFESGLTETEIMNKITGHILGTSEIIGLYKYAD